MQKQKWDKLQEVLYNECEYIMNNNQNESCRDNALYIKSEIERNIENIDTGEIICDYCNLRKWIKLLRKNDYIICEMYFINTREEDIYLGLPTF